MVSQKDIYISAQLLIQQHGEQAESIAMQRLQVLMDKDDVQGASVWLSVACAIEDLQNLNHQGKLH